MDTVEVLSIPFRRSWRIIGSCNGLLCVEVIHNRGRSSSSLWLWNPVIREVIEVPSTLNDHRYVCCLGFGFSSIVNDYKIVRFYNQELRRKRENQYFQFIKHDRVEVFSLSTGSWKELESEALRHTEVLRGALNADGTIFWSGFRSFSSIIISFDIAREVFTLTPTPRPTEHDVSFGVYGNKLEGHYVIKEGPGSHFIGVCEVEDVASASGNGLSCIQKDRVGPMSGVIRPVCVWRNEIVCYHIKETEVEGNPKCVLHMFNLITNERRTFNCSIDCDWCDIFNYDESLVSVWNTQVP
ncbi:F-box/kelch-repeat protein At3g06240-like isoform X2 [Neltuma alba]|uniref:F-box/kelch-repeat protein At3g06240-like isoform X2 n=1 Tax=Neltuma alba TaxID=207710 RepID=UPI0010A5790B|nr:F-box/kelch-repeat protein At3g06240-like isoform X2 [Prosopis alba]XP_028754856.1 F-box/kelch-repeat protein At3g06240-like isoform X2 [Prosopis alba]